MDVEYWNDGQNNISDMIENNNYYTHLEIFEKYITSGSFMCSWSYFHYRLYDY